MVYVHGVEGIGWPMREEKYESIDAAARRAARLIYKDCLGRCGIKHEFSMVDDCVKYKEILPDWVEIIKGEMEGCGA